MKKALILCLWAIAHVLQSQEIFIQGRILDGGDSTAVSYATIGVERKNFGTVASDEGYFSYRFDANGQLAATDSFVVSCVGYYPKKYGTDLKRGFTTIYLVPRKTMMNEVVVRPSGKCREVELGKANHFGLVSVDYFVARDKRSDDNLSREMGSVIRLNPRKIYQFNQLNVYVVGSDFKSVLFRVAIYKMDEGKIVSENILNSDILWEIKNDSHGWKRFDLTPYRIMLSQTTEVAVCLQWVRSEPVNEKSKYFSIKASVVPEKNWIFRDKSRSEWSYNTGNIAIYVDAKSCE